MWSDNEAVVDLLNVQHLVGVVRRVIRDDRLDPVTIGVYGDWGSGKSSVIQLVRQKIAADSDLLCVYFNGWRFEGYEDAKAALAATILEEIELEAKKAGGKLETVKGSVGGTIKKLWGRIDHLRAGKLLSGMGMNAGIAAGGAMLAATGGGGPLTASALGVAALASLLKDAKQLDGPALAELITQQQVSDANVQREMHASIRDFHREFAELVETLGIKRLVVVVDDLDRCLPVNVIETLEAIRLFLAAPKTAFVIAADEALIREAVAHRYPERAQLGDERDRDRARASVGARYLEKLIQVPIRVPPLSRSDLHGYLNLLFAEQRTSDAAAFAALCDRAQKAAPYDTISFHVGNAEELLQTPLSEELKSDLVLAEQIAPVLALCAEGNPRQTKRFLNALVLRIDMARDRGVTLDRAVAAKLLLLEYFLPEVFRSLALAAAANDGRSNEIRAVEAAAGSTGRGSVAEGTRESVAATTGAFTDLATAMNATERFQTWLRTEPMLGAVDLRPYVYFANERYAIPVGVSQRLSPVGARILRELLSESESAHNTAADGVTTLPLAEVTAIIGELAAHARSGKVDLGERNSPMHAMAKVAVKRPDVGGDIIVAFLSIPLDMLRPGSAILVEGLGKEPCLFDAAKAALTRWKEQNQNAALQSAAALRLAKLLAPSEPGRR